MPEIVLFDGLTFGTPILKVLLIVCVCPQAFSTTAFIVNAPEVIA